MVAIGDGATVVCDDDAILDNQFDRAHMVDVIDRVSPHGDQIRQLARLDGAKPVAHPAELRSVFGRRQEGLPRGGSGLDPQLHLLMYSVPKWSSVRSDSHLYPRLQGSLEPVAVPV